MVIAFSIYSIVQSCALLAITVDLWGRYSNAFLVDQEQDLADLVDLVDLVDLEQDLDLYDGSYYDINFNIIMFIP